MEKVKLGDLQIDRNIWVRKSISLDQVRCLVNDLYNGDELPPLKVDKETKVIVGGNHRYTAYKQYYGDGWEGKTVDVEWLNLPPHDTDPSKWLRAAMDDNQHLAERLSYSDRNKSALNICKMLEDPESVEAKEMARLLHFTPQSWSETVIWYKTQTTLLEKKEVNSGDIYKSKKVKTPVNDVNPTSAPKNDSTPVARAMAKVAGLLDALDGLSPVSITPNLHSKLKQLVGVIEMLLEENAV
jgi:hypothetical protein